MVKHDLPEWRGNQHGLLARGVGSTVRPAQDERPLLGIGAAVLVAARLGRLVWPPEVVGARRPYGRNRVTESQHTEQDETPSEADLAAVAAALADDELDDDALGMVSGGKLKGEA